MFEKVYRLPKTGIVNQLIMVRSTGFYRVWSGWKDLAIRKYFLELFWCISGSGEFTLEDGSSFTLRPGECCCYYPGDCHRIQATSNFEFCWVTFDGPDCQSLIDRFELTRTPWQAGKCPQKLFMKLRSEISRPGAEGEIRSGAIGYELLVRAKTPDTGQDTLLAERFISIVEKEFDNPELTIDGIASTLDVHRSTLVRNIGNICGISPQKYLTDYRMRQAFDLLHETHFSIKEIAERTGFASPNYFGKVFLKTFGRTPCELRELHEKSSRIP